MEEQVFSRTLGATRSWELFNTGKIVPRERRNYGDCNTFSDGKHTFWFPFRCYYDKYWSSHGTIAVVVCKSLPEPKFGKGYYYNHVDCIDNVIEEVITEKEVIPDEVYAAPDWDKDGVDFLITQYGIEFVCWLGSLPLFDGPPHSTHFKEEERNENSN